MTEGEGSQTTLLLLSLLLATGMTEKVGPLFKHGLLFQASLQAAGIIASKLNKKCISLPGSSIYKS